MPGALCHTGDGYRRTVALVCAQTHGRSEVRLPIVLSRKMSFNKLLIHPICVLVMLTCHSRTARYQDPGALFALFTRSIFCSASFFCILVLQPHLAKNLFHVSVSVSATVPSAVFATKEATARVYCLHATAQGPWAQCTKVAWRSGCRLRTPATVSCATQSSALSADHGLSQR